MEQKMKKFYLTTPIYYVNDLPHLGHAYTTILADVIKRFKMLQGYEVYLLTGTDEHGQKIEKSAEKMGLSPKQLADRVVDRYKALWKTFNISYDKFIRTTDEYHILGVQKIFQRVFENKDIYEGEYRGYYCISCEFYLPETAQEGPEGTRICPDCGKRCNQIAEKCFYFRLSAYQEKLLQFYEQHPDFIVPESRFNEVKAFVKAGLRDLSISRASVKWGIPVPFAPEQTIYVWFDALSNYITAVNYLEEDERFKKFWPADLHIMAKDILRFHAVYWPAFLMAAGLTPPRQELIHGWWLKDDRKMSKSAGNVLDPAILLEYFSADAIRYFLVREAAIGNDGNFSHEGFLTRINADLSNDWGNLVSRALAMTAKYFQNRIPEKIELREREKMLEQSFFRMQPEVIRYFESYQFNRGLEIVFDYINQLNRYIVEAEPWNLARLPEKRAYLAGVLASVVEAIANVNSLLWPIMPVACEKVAAAIGQKQFSLEWQKIKLPLQIQELDILFPRIEQSEFFALEQKREQEADNLIEIDDFKKIELVAAEVLEASRVENAEKLLQLKIDLGDQVRYIIAGIAQFYKPEELIGKKIVVLKNLKPAKIRGLLSQGMLLAAADSQNRPFVAFLPQETPNGARLK